MIADEKEDIRVARIAAAIGEPARTRMLHCLLDGHARTSTELAIVAEVSPSTASVHLDRLRTGGLVKLLVQGRHRYYSLKGEDVARALEALSVLAGKTQKKFVPNTPGDLRFARTCYDHMAGTASVLLHDRFKTLGWISEDSTGNDNAYALTPEGKKAFDTVGVDLETARKLRRRFAYACLDWSERQPHVGGALGAALLQTALKRKWVEKDLNSRALDITRHGKREMLARFGLQL
jgi:DNA-binding transcriptional ArsR family regulator